MEEEIKKVNKKKRKVLFIILSLVFLLAAGIWEYYIFNDYNKEEKVPIKYGEIVLDMDNGKVLDITAPNSECDDTGYIPIGYTKGEVIVAKKGVSWVLWQDNRNENCAPSNYRMSYIVNDEILAGYFSSDTTLPLTKVIVNGMEYGFLKREYTPLDAVNTEESGIVVQKEPTIIVRGYEAFRIFDYIKVHNSVNQEEISKNNEIFTDSEITTYCVFDLNKISEGLKGYLLFMGESEMANTEVNYCEILNNTKEFKIKVRDREEVRK